MKNVFSFILLLVLSAGALQAQTIEELKAKKTQLMEAQGAKQAEADAFNGELTDLSKQIELLSGWQTGISGLLGLNFGSSNNWQANANRNSSSSTLNIGINGYANNIKEKTFWRNTLNTNISWQGLDNDTKDNVDGGGFLENRNGDVLIVSSLYGLRLSKDIAATALADLNTSVFNFLNPGTVDVGIGATWTPSSIPNLVVVAHPLTYNFAFSGVEGVESQSALGAKIKATYALELPGGVAWSSNLGVFLPYSNEKTEISFLDEANVLQTSEEGLFAYTWINSFNIADLWKGVGLGFTVGIRQAGFEYPPGLQSYTALGLTYGF
jgi:FtsZ-binding cell division protein ZapB